MYAKNHIGRSNFIPDVLSEKNAAGMLDFEGRNQQISQPTH